jgi:broad specificity phosphatase PhoE
MSPIALLIVFVPPSQSFYFVRHGETVANATGRYNSKTLNQFSTRGEQEVKSLTAQLLTMPRFDLILVSPSPRALKTIEPYLERTRQQATIWPLLDECCTGKRPKDAAPAPFGYGPWITLPIALNPYFRLMPDESRIPEAPLYSEGLAQVRAAVAEFNRRFRGKRVLLVGHSGQGGHFLHDLTGKWKKLENAKLVMGSLPK